MVRPCLHGSGQNILNGRILPVQPVYSEPCKLCYTTVFTSPYKFLLVSALEWPYFYQRRVKRLQTLTSQNVQKRARFWCLHESAKSGTVPIKKEMDKNGPTSDRLKNLLSSRVPCKRKADPWKFLFVKNFPGPVLTGSKSIQPPDGEQHYTSVRQTIYELVIHIPHCKITF